MPFNPDESAHATSTSTTAHNPYLPPRSSSNIAGEAPFVRARVVQLRRFRNALLIAAMGVQLVAIVSPIFLALSLPLALLAVAVAAILEGRATWIANDTGGTLPWSAAFVHGTATLFGGVLTSSAVAVGASMIAAHLGNGFTRGRQLRARGRVLLPRLTSGDEWARETKPLEVPDELRARLAARWRENGKTEHASVAAFAKLSLELVALGAPPSLLEGASRDASDEIRHTEACFSLARAIDGDVQSPAPFPAAITTNSDGGPRDRASALRRLAVDSLFDGALHEGVSARILAKLARRCEIPEIATILRALAADEGRHAAHGWDVVRFCVERGGDDTLRVLQGAAAALPETMTTELPPEARDGAWEKYGIHGEALEAAEYAATLRDLRERVAALGSAHGHFGSLSDTRASA